MRLRYRTSHYQLFLASGWLPLRSRATRFRRRPAADLVSVDLKCGNPHGYWCFERSGLTTVAVSTNWPRLGFRLSPHRDWQAAFAVLMISAPSIGGCQPADMAHAK